MKFSTLFFRFSLLVIFFFMPVQVAAQFTEYVPTKHRLFVEPAETRLANSNYVPLFNGKDFDGWEITGESKWEIVDGAMVARPGNPEATTRGMAGCEAELANFILRFQYSIEPDPDAEQDSIVNSGVFFRVPINAQRKSLEGYEMEISANDEYEYPTGSIWRLTRAYPGLSNANIWNDAEICANGDHIRISVNGRIAMEVFDRRSPGGTLFFQHQRAGLVRFRDIEVMRLPDTPELPLTIEEQLEQEPGEFVPLFNGKDLAGWEAYGEKPEDKPRFGVENGAMVVLPDSDKGFLVNEAVFGDFILKLKFFMPDDGESREGDSGIFVRSGANGQPDGLEAQIENVRDWHHWNPTGSIYGLGQAMFGWFKFNDWNEYTLYVMGDRMTVYLNGQRTSSAMISFNPRTREPFPGDGQIKIEAIQPFNKLQLKDISIKKIR